MTAIDHVSPTPRFASRLNLVTRVVTALSTGYKALLNRRAFYRLGELSDAELADIGLTRADLHVAVGHPLAADPTAALSIIVRRRGDAGETAARKVC